MTKIKTLGEKVLEIEQLESLFPGIAARINAYIYKHSQEDGPFPGGKYSISWDEGEIRGGAYAETEDYRVLGIHARRWCERETFDPYSHHAIASNRSESIGVVGTKMGGIIIYYRKKGADEKIMEIKTPRTTLESYPGHIKGGRDLLNFDFVGIDHFSKNVIEVTWLNQKRKKGPSYRIDLTSGRLMS